MRITQIFPNLRPIPRASTFWFCWLGFLSFAVAAPSNADSTLPIPGGLAIRTEGRGARSAFHTDPIEQLLVTGQWKAVQAGDTVLMPDGTTRSWEPVTPTPDGVFTNAAIRGGYVYLPVISEIDQVVHLQAAGHSMVYANGEPRTGDPYRNGSVSLPVWLHRGTNELLFRTARGGLRVGLVRPDQPWQIDLRDTTAPDLIENEKNDVWAAVLVVNNTTNRIEDLTLTTSSQGGKTTQTPVPALLPLSTRKVGFRLRHSGRSDTNQVPFTLQLSRGAGRRAQRCDTKTFTLRLRDRQERRKETFVSSIDGSVQYFAATPARPLSAHPPPLALVLSAHGAGVEASGQAAAYAAKTWAHLVAPTNRRPYGFDWEDWGRDDAMEVLAHAQTKFGTDPAQTYLTGHSMGGHGTWQLGAIYPDRFAAIAPSAGWISFFSYAGGRRDASSHALDQLLQRAANTSDTLAMASNYLHHGIYILHGDADDNVPVSEARAMRKVLETFHHDFTWHEQPGAGHWWGNACVDWPPIFDLFARHKIPADESVRAIHFTTVNPGVSASSHWAMIAAQQHDLAPSTVDVQWDPDHRRFSGTTENVARLAFDLRHVPSGPPPTATLDGQTLTNLTITASTTNLWFGFSDGVWKQIPMPLPSEKGPHRYGPFKTAFRHRMLFVYGTGGTPEENAWAMAKARFDAETFWYRGNGSIDVVPDTDFDPHADPDRGVILYGHAESNRAWPSLLSESPVQVHRGHLTIGNRKLLGNDLACLFLRPRPGSQFASVGIVTGTGLAGLRLNDRVPYFMSGVAFPDCTVFKTETLQKGAEGAVAAGFFGSDWSVESGEFEWRK